MTLYKCSFNFDDNDNEDDDDDDDAGKSEVAAHFSNKEHKIDDILTELCHEGDLLPTM